jgi:hypothetical protein
VLQEHSELEGLEVLLLIQSLFPEIFCIDIKVDNYWANPRKLKKLLARLKTLKVTEDAKMVYLNRGTAVTGNWRISYDRTIKGVQEAVMSEVGRECCGRRWC